MKNQRINRTRLAAFGWFAGFFLLGILPGLSLLFFAFSPAEFFRVRGG
jgi:hypothetical protein